MKHSFVILDLECDESANLNGQGRVGGPDACQVKPHSKPWAVNLRGCGGTLIGKRVVLTAAHCICKCDDFLGICQPAAKCDQWTRNRYVVVGEHDTIKNEKEDQKIENALQNFPQKYEKEKFTPNFQGPLIEEIHITAMA